MRQMSIPRMIAVGVVVCLAGAVAGGFFGARWQWNKLQPKPEPREHREEESQSREDKILCWMRDYLDLTAEQEKEIRPLLRLAITEYYTMQQEQRQRIYGLIDRSDQRISEHLDERQKELLFRHSRERRQEK